MESHPKLKGCRINIAKITLLPEAICGFIVPQMKITISFFTEIGKKKIQNVIWNHKRSWIAKTILNKRKNYLKSFKILRYIVWSYIVRQTIWSWHKTEYPNKSVCNFNYLTFDTGAKIITWREESIFNRWCLETGCPHEEELN